jgi:hypothetical protein
VWEQVVDDGFDNPNNYFISELVPNPFPGGDNSLYAGTLNGFDGMELWKIMSCQEDAVADVVTSQVFGGGWPGPSECPLPSIGLISLCVTNSGALTLQTATINIFPYGSKPALFLGTVNYILGASLFVSIDGTNFLPVFLFGNGDDRLSYVWSMQEYMGRLYIGTFQRPNLRNLLDLPSDFDLDISSVDALDPDKVETYMSFLEDLGGSFDTPALPGITNLLSFLLISLTLVLPNFLKAILWLRLTLRHQTPLVAAISTVFAPCQCMMTSSFLDLQEPAAREVPWSLRQQRGLARRRYVSLWIYACMKVCAGCIHSVAVFGCEVPTLI